MKAIAAPGRKTGSRGVTWIEIDACLTPDMTNDQQVFIACRCSNVGLHCTLYRYVSAKTVMLTMLSETTKRYAPVLLRIRAFIAQSLRTKPNKDLDKQKLVSPN